MATRAKPKEIVIESQKFFGVVAKILKWVAITLAVITIFTVVVWSISDLRNGEATKATSQPAPMSTLSMPANGDSPKLPVHIGHPVAFTGSGFTTHCVYTDGSEGIVGSTEYPCKDGPMTHFYLHDTSGKPNTATYEVR